MTTLIGGAGRRGDWAGALALFGEAYRGADRGARRVVTLRPRRAARPRRWSLPYAFPTGGARTGIGSAAAIPDDQGRRRSRKLGARIARGEPAAHAIAALRRSHRQGQRWTVGRGAPAAPKKATRVLSR